ncbi:hypothetical protein [Desulfobacula phenolica]|uniref:Condensation domain-containing protein n=1 Tax=Desulfobacula phenolica TaxID=90732 RepID=A0A1H2IHL8_9BACT|nr:hypothetical protein [Desulfobacula phenolica]SDU43660.1 hypothetical protein SAMN04487931_108201 [Desulfobacula phenolica]
MIFFNTSRRYYLNGIDWVMAALDRINIKHTGLGNHSQLVLVLKGYLDKKNLTNKLSKTLSNSAFLRGKTKRAWHLAPYWVSEQQNFDPEDIRFFKLESNNQTIENNLNKIIQDCARTPFKDDKTLLGFDLIHSNNSTYLIMRFNHRMFDARGAEALLGYLLDEQKSDEKYTLPSQGAQLNLWKSRFLSGQRINRFLRSIYSKEIQVVQINDQSDASKSESNNSHCFHCFTFSEKQTSTIDENAIKKAGYLMNGIYILSCVTKSFDSLFKKRNSQGNMLVPINVDVRETKFSTAKIFFNNVSFMLFNVKQGLSITDYIISFKTQFIDQVKNKIPYHFINASLLMRIMPLKILSFFMNFRMRKKPCSFSFSYISEQAFNLKSVQNFEVLNLFHMPLVPINPGIGVFFTRFNKKINMVISSFDNNLSKQDGKYLQEEIISRITFRPNQ